MALSPELKTRIGGTTVLRNPNLDGLSNAQLKQFAPTIFAKSGIEGVSEKYGFVSSAQIIDAMRDSGFEPMEVRFVQKRGDDAEHRLKFTKHMIKFRKAGTVKRIQRGDVLALIVMLNSHDRSSGFHLYPGLFRLVCGNGLMVSESAVVEPIRIPHTQKLVQDVTEKSRILIQGADGVYRLRDEMLSVEMSPKQQIMMATDALACRPRRRLGVMEPEMLLTPRRPEDDLPDMWHVWNRIQENMFRAGNTTTTADGRRATTQGIGRIDRDVEINSKLWKIAVEAIEKAKRGSKPGARGRAKAQGGAVQAKSGRSLKAKIAEAAGVTDIL